MRLSSVWAFQFDIWNCNEKSWNINITSRFLRFICDQRKTKYNNLGASNNFRLFFIHHLITKRMKLNTFCLMNVDTFFMKHFFFALFFPVVDAWFCAPTTHQQQRNKIEIKNISLKLLKNRRIECRNVVKTRRTSHEPMPPYFIHTLSRPFSLSWPHKKRHEKSNLCVYSTTHFVIMKYNECIRFSCVRLAIGFVLEFVSIQTSSKLIRNDDCWLFLFFCCCFMNLLENSSEHHKNRSTMNRLIFVAYLMWIP